MPQLPPALTGCLQAGTRPCSRGEPWRWAAGPLPLSERSCPRSLPRTSPTDLFLLLLGLEADDLQVAGVGDVCHDAGNLAPDPQQGPAQHVVVTQPHALEALLPLLDQLAAPVPSVQRGENLNRHGRALPSPAWPFPAATAQSPSPAPRGAGRASRSGKVWAAHPLPDSMVTLLQGELVTALPVFLGFLGQHLQKKSQLQTGAGIFLCPTPSSHFRCRAWCQDTQMLPPQLCLTPNGATRGPKRVLVNVLRHPCPEEGARCSPRAAGLPPTRRYFLCRLSRLSGWLCFPILGL